MYLCKYLEDETYNVYISSRTPKIWSQKSVFFLLRVCWSVFFFSSCLFCLQDRNVCIKKVLKAEFA